LVVGSVPAVLQVAHPWNVRYGVCEIHGARPEDARVRREHVACGRRATGHSQRLSRTGSGQSARAPNPNLLGARVS